MGERLSGNAKICRMCGKKAIDFRYSHGKLIEKPQYIVDSENYAPCGISASSEWYLLPNRTVRQIGENSQRVHTLAGEN